MTFEAPVADAGRLVLFGATGDLARRMLWPSLYTLDLDALLPADFRIVGAAHSRWSGDEFVAKVREAIVGSANAKLFEAAAFERFARRIAYVSVDALAPGGLAPLAAALEGADARPTVFYLSTAPALFGPIARALGESGLARPADRIVVEKPIGHDVASARETNAAIASAFDESRVYRIDHYLGKEAVQNLLALRFGNSILE